MIKSAPTFYNIPLNLMPLINEYLCSPNFLLVSTRIYKSISKDKRSPEFYQESLDIHEETTQEEFDLIIRRSNYVTELNVSKCSLIWTLMNEPTKLKYLKKLWCHRTSIKELPSNLNQLEILFCSDTKISEIPRNMPNLQILNCSNTNVTKISRNFTKLDILFCSIITEIPSNILHRLKYIKY